MKPVKTQKLRINYGETINMGNYESKRLDISLEIEIDENEFDVESNELFLLLRNKFDQLMRTNS